EHGGFDVAINNAGYSVLGSIEDTTLVKVYGTHKQVGTTHYGLIRVLQDSLPVMRQKRIG
ncbi:hypothetical protein ASPCADRAFT_31594, partial [Aspergillus carbonarius ITEM 5010]